MPSVMLVYSGGPGTFKTDRLQRLLRVELFILELSEQPNFFMKKCLSSLPKIHLRTDPYYSGRTQVIDLLLDDSDGDAPLFPPPAPKVNQLPADSAWVDKPIPFLQYTSM